MSLTEHTYRAATVGMFDGVHLGHRQVLDQLRDVAREHGLTPTVFTFDRHPMSLIAPERAPKVLTTNAQKADLLVRYGAEEVVFFQFNDTMRNMSADDFLSMLHTKYHVERLIVGFNHHFGRDREGSFDDYRRVGEEIGISLIQAHEFSAHDVSQPISSSSIRRLVSEGDVLMANKMLGHPFTLSGYVAHGRNIGSKIGFPTANISPYSANQQIPHNGVYAAYVNVAGASRLPAMVNVGTNPTIQAATHPLSIEAHIIGFDDDVYNRPIEVSFITRIRDEKTFTSVDALTRQLALDRTAAIALLS